MTATTSPRALLCAAYEARKRVDATLTHASLGERSGIARANVTRALNGPAEPRPDTVRRILGALEFGLALVDLRAAP